MVIPALLGCKRAWAAPMLQGGWTQGTNESEAGGGATTDVKAHRLYAGVDSGANAAQDGDNFYHFFAMLPKISSDGRPIVSMQAVKKSSSYITTLPGQNFSETSSVRYIFAKDAKDLTQYPVPEEWNVGYVGKILLLFDDVNGDNKTSKEDITDEVLQRYYSNILDNSAPDAPTGLKIERSDATGSGNESIYGRYNVTWNAPTTGSPAIYYHITVYETDENGDRIGNTSPCWRPMPTTPALPLKVRPSGRAAISRSAWPASTTRVPARQLFRAGSSLSAPCPRRSWRFA